MSTVEESPRQCEKLGSSITAVSQESESWWKVTSNTMTSISEQESYLHMTKTQLQCLQKDVEDGCSSSVVQVTEMVNQDCDAQYKALAGLVGQVKDDQEGIKEQKLELQQQAQDGLNKVPPHRGKGYKRKRGKCEGEAKEVVPEQYSNRQEDFQIAVSSVYSGTDDHLSASSSRLQATASSVTTSFNSIQETVSRQVAQSTDEILKQEGLSSQAKADLQKLMADHRSALQKAPITDMLPITNYVLDLNSKLNRCLQNFSAVADKVDSHKEDMNVFFTNHSMMLHKLRLDSTSALSSLQTECRLLEEGFQAAEALHLEGVNVPNSLDLLSLKTNQSFKGFMLKRENIQQLSGSLQQDLENVTLEAIERTSTHHKNFGDWCGDVVSEFGQLAALNMSTVEESPRQCEKLGSSITAVSQESESWWKVTSNTMTSISEQESYLHMTKTQLQCLQKDVEDGCSSSVVQVTEMVNQDCDAQYKALAGLVGQAKDDQLLLFNLFLELQQQAQDGLNKVYSYIKEELRNDIPTGTTPQRKGL
ncbi:LOW QUALITY PROTEIN: kinesin-like protein KIF11-B [Mixophyes fleayi]|uniref:LOW QUALITY PROTEIN: kinesin-like protein KIF11-B n=1 Tax=Mixophyes fleayi TaxID=3061075 RepID=UPI003F4DABA0